ncbi:MAG: YjbQ family protein [candidate division WOR-3 bacterium]|nr:MAG: YjbQ family protein [candidate division WOR-3 bacterium]
MVYSRRIELKTAGFCDVNDITEELRRIVAESGVTSGIACVANPGSTAGITTLEFEPGAIADLQDALERLAPAKGRYKHDATWGDGNGFAHLRSALVRTSLAVPVHDRALVLGTWQQVVFLDFDNRPRKRKLQVVVVGE